LWLCVMFMHCQSFSLAANYTPSMPYLLSSSCAIALSCLQTNLLYRTVPRHILPVLWSVLLFAFFTLDQLTSGYIFLKLQVFLGCRKLVRNCECQAACGVHKMCVFTFSLRRPWAKRQSFTAKRNTWSPVFMLTVSIFTLFVFVLSISFLLCTSQFQSCTQPSYACSKWIWISGNYLSPVRQLRWRFLDHTAGERHLICGCSPQMSIEGYLSNLLFSFSFICFRHCSAQLITWWSHTINCIVLSSST